MSSEVVIIDYGIGNIFSVRRAFEFCGAEVVVTDDPQKIFDAKRLVLPGVGAFADGMQGIVNRGLDKVIQEYANSDKPLLGICLGMQMLASVSEEFGEHNGLGIIPGRVKSIPKINPQGNIIKVPFVGWADLQSSTDDNDWYGSVLEGINVGDAIYLTHSYAVTPDNLNHRLAYCIYDGVEVTTALSKSKTYGVQFHPEKSGPIGLKIIKNFMNISL